jgi:hypothetical protein
LFIFLNFYLDYIGQESAFSSACPKMAIKHLGYQQCGSIGLAETQVFIYSLRRLFITPGRGKCMAGCW